MPDCVIREESSKLNAKEKIRKITLATILQTVFVTSLKITIETMCEA
jgi:hypothetical protein